ncbi:unnamed protein product [Vitrella brassicaformis CCMP3155]|uniref:ADP-ribosylglycohydrolase n=2 Tax=Vitrella brassicaformis TaxID=1169539 RepID=A0A0G4EGB7_VITBC|nr:unnamed protein product [Vitrella brassicaformis CCMP3155]|eukprot:CEL94525.1 unnamed protein product [Vitrella brassicaformis CCMP3155]
MRSCVGANASSADDQSDVAKKVESKGGEAAFYSSPSCPFYKYPKGSLSCYGDEATPLLHSIARQGKDFHLDTFAEDFFTWAKGYHGRLNHMSKEFVSNRDAGKSWDKCASGSKDAHNLIKIPIIAARWAGTPDYMTKVEQITQLHQYEPIATVVARVCARIYEKVLLGATPKGAFEAVLSDGSSPPDERAVLEKAKSKQGEPYPKAVKELGLSCALPGSGEAALLSLLVFDGYHAAVEGNILAAGDNCSRSLLLAGVFAAASGADFVPSSWQHKTTALPELTKSIDAVVDLNPALSE